MTNDNIQESLEGQFGDVQKIILIIAPARYRMSMKRIYV